MQDVRVAAAQIAAPAWAGGGLTDPADEYFAPAARPMPLRALRAAPRPAPADLLDLPALPDLAPLPEAILPRREDGGRTCNLGVLIERSAPPYAVAYSGARRYLAARA